MTDEPRAVPMSRSVAAESARSRAVESARTESAQLAEGVVPMLTALASIRDRNRRSSAESARVRALGLERLPDSEYVALCIDRLRAELDASHPRRKWLAAVRFRADEVQGLLHQAIALTSVTDIVGELELPLGLVTAVQTGARAGLSSITRLRGHLHDVEVGPVEAQPRAARAVRRASGQPTPSAQWLVRLASRLLPVVGRHRYLEEFSAELHDLAEGGAGSGGQLGHALRLAVRAWALRQALSTTGPPRPLADPDRIRVQTRPDSGRSAAARPSEGLLAAVERRRARRDARLIVRIQARQKRKNDADEDRAAAYLAARHRPWRWVAVVSHRIRYWINGPRRPRSLGRHGRG